MIPDVRPDPKTNEGRLSPAGHFGAYAISFSVSGPAPDQRQILDRRRSTAVRLGDTMKQMAKHVIKIAAWGLLAVSIWFIICQITVIQIMGRHRFEIPGAGILDWIQHVLTLPCLWIRPGSIFDNLLPILTIMALFWGLFIHGTVVFIKKMKTKKIT